MSTTHCGNIFESAQKGCVECFRLFRKSNVDDERPITMAVKYAHTDIIDYLISEKGISSWKCVYYSAIVHGHLHIVKYLHKKKFPWDTTISDCAIRFGQLPILDYLCEHGCPVQKTAVNIAALYGQLECLKYLRIQGSDWDRATIQYAEANGYVNILQYLHENNYPYIEDRGLYAAHHGNIRVLKYLHEHGYKLHQEVFGRATLMDQYDTTKYLLNIGYLPYKIEQGVKMTFLAAERGDLNTLQLVLGKKFTLHKEAADIAAENGHINILEFLKSAGHPFHIHSEKYAPDINALKFLKSADIKFSERIMIGSIAKCKIDSVEYLLSISCPYDRNIWFATDNIETLLYMRNKKLDYCPDSILQKITRHISGLAFKEVKRIRRCLIPIDVWNIIEHMIILTIPG